MNPQNIKAKIHKQAEITCLDYRRKSHLRTFMCACKSNSTFLDSEPDFKMLHDGQLFNIDSPKRENDNTSKNYRDGTVWNSLVANIRNIP